MAAVASAGAEVANVITTLGLEWARLTRERRENEARYKQEAENDVRDSREANYDEVQRRKKSYADKSKEARTALHAKNKPGQYEKAPNQSSYAASISGKVKKKKHKKRHHRH